MLTAHSPRAGIVMRARRGVASIFAGLFSTDPGDIDLDDRLNKAPGLLDQVKRTFFKGGEEVEFSSKKRHLFQSRSSSEKSSSSKSSSPTLAVRSSASPRSQSENESLLENGASSSSRAESDKKKSTRWSRLSSRAMSCFSWRRKSGDGKDGSKGKDGDDDEKKASVDQADLKRLFMLARPELRNVVIGFTALIITQCTSMTIPMAFGRVVDSMAAADGDGDVTADAGQHTGLVLVLLAVFAVGAVATLVRSYYLAIASERVISRLKKRLYRKIVNQDMGFFDAQKTGYLTTLLSSDVEIVGRYFSGSRLASDVGSLIRLVLALGCMIYTSSTLCMVIFFIIPFCFAVGKIHGRYVRSVGKQLSTSVSDTMELMEERISSIRTVRSFAQENLEAKRYGSEIDKNFGLRLRMGFVFGGFHGITMLLVNTCMVCILWYGGYLIQNGHLSTGELTSFMFYAMYVGGSSFSVLSMYTDMIKGLIASVRVFDVIDKKPEIDNTKGIFPTHVEGRLSFENVRFRYPARPDAVIFEDLTFEVPAGRVLALVGASGAGKSTITSLLMRFYDPSEGYVRLDNTDIREVNPLWLRNHISIVSQEPKLFSGTIAENIMYGLGEVDSDRLLEKYPDEVPPQVMQAAREANAHDFISKFPDGYDTLVGERGTALSGGQKQRVAIARALLKNPEILLLDEATSALDAESEQLVQEALERAMKNRTVIIIAHRLSTVQNADQIAVLEAGRIVEIGTHRDLMSRKESAYRQLMSIQMDFAAKSSGLGDDVSEWP